MADVLLTMLGFLILLAACTAGYLRWVRPRPQLRGVQTRGLLLLLILTLMGGSIGAIFWWFDQPRSFSWDLPPLASRMLAAAGWSFGLASLLALQRPTTGRVRLVLVMLATYVLPILSVGLTLHLDRFDFSKLITVGFFAIAGSMSVATVWYLVRRPALLPDEGRDTAPASALVRTWLVTVATVAAPWGLALFATDRGRLAQVWVWPGDPLTSRLIAVMLLTIATGALVALWRADTARMMLAAIAVYGGGVSGATLWNLLDGKPVKEAYAVMFGLLAAGSLVLLLVERPTTAGSRAPAFRPANR